MLQSSALLRASRLQLRCTGLFRHSRPLQMTHMHRNLSPLARAGRIAWASTASEAVEQEEAATSYLDRVKQKDLETLQDTFGISGRLEGVTPVLYPDLRPDAIPEPVRPPKSPFVQDVSGYLHKLDQDAPAGVITLPHSVFAQPIRQDLMHATFVHERNWKRQGSKTRRTRGQVRGSTRKIMQQKGSGKARRGDRRAPNLKGGGAAFGFYNRDYKTGLNNKVRFQAICVLMTLKLQQNNLVILDNFEYDELEGKSLTDIFGKRHWGQSKKPLLFVDSKAQEYVEATNDTKIVVEHPENMNIIKGLGSSKLIITRGALEILVSKYTAYM